jgi:hypothetical protein
MTEPLIHIRHVRMMLRNGRRALCANGIMAWCERHGIDIEQLGTTGVPGERALEIGDDFALRALEFARQEAAANGQG